MTPPSARGIVCGSMHRQPLDRPSVWSSSSRSSSSPLLHVFRLIMFPPWPPVLPRLHLHPPRLCRQSCSLYPDSTLSTSATASNIDILPPRHFAHRDCLGDLLCWSSQKLMFVHGGPYLRVSGIDATGVCIHP
jgi:hypothetical protein